MRSITSIRLRILIYTVIAIDAVFTRKTNIEGLPSTAQPRKRQVDQNNFGSSVSGIPFIPPVEFTCNSAADCRFGSQCLDNSNCECRTQTCAFGTYCYTVQEELYRCPKETLPTAHGTENRRTTTPKRTPCSLLECGVNTKCRISSINFTPECICKDHYTLNPNTNTGCIRANTGTQISVPGVGCRSDSDCDRNSLCLRGKCVHGCTSAVCGSSAKCTYTNGFCECLEGYDGDPLKECTKRGPNSSVSSKCRADCGRNTECRLDSNGNFQCRCKANYVESRDKSGCVGVPGSKCATLLDCPEDSTCHRDKCVNACTVGNCGFNSKCIPLNHEKVCSCPRGYEGDPKRECTKREPARTVRPRTSRPSPNKHFQPARPGRPNGKITAPHINFECGKRLSNSITVKVTGSQSVVSEKNAWPWMALVGHRRGSIDGNNVRRRHNHWFCGGVLINERWVLSAAHCLNQVNTFFVRLGVNKKDKSNDRLAEHIDYDVSTRIIHPNYTSSNPQYFDFVLFELDRFITISVAIRPICLPWHLSDSDLPEGRALYITGWGSTYYRGAPSELLRESIVFIKNTAQCHENYTIGEPYFESKFPQGITDELIICASDPKTKADSCSGDSGGPLSMLSKDTGLFTLVGITSGGIGCGLTHLPGQYGPVIKQLQWIKENAFRTVSYSCESDNDCKTTDTCFSNECVDPCENCGLGASCTVVNREHFCFCQEGMRGDPYSVCTIES